MKLYGLSPNPLIFLLFHFFQTVIPDHPRHWTRRNGDPKDEFGPVWDQTGSGFEKDEGFDWVISEVKINIDQNQKTD